MLVNKCECNAQISMHINMNLRVSLSERVSNRIIFSLNPCEYMYELRV